MTTPASVLIVEALLALPFVILGLSHIVQRHMWVDFFNGLAAQGHAGVVWRSMALEIWPAALIIALHQDWSWPGVVITAYGHLLMFKVGVSLLFPAIGRRSLQQAEKSGTAGFVVAGLVLIGLGFLCGYRAFVMSPP
ncbi:MAG: hypothetical protein AAF280_14040 [Pseudomonadota bacterium]